ncbi:hypothetical protein CDD83_7166 [Cordyceps sp. RAO-2017]|nr:hypothetical protein CDD83_7166 [Cordyceps sp. RAO-2017]
MGLLWWRRRGQGCLERNQDVGPNPPAKGRIYFLHPPQGAPGEQRAGRSSVLDALDIHTGCNASCPYADDGRRRDEKEGKDSDLAVPRLSPAWIWILAAHPIRRRLLDKRPGAMLPWRLRRVAAPRIESLLGRSVRPGRRLPPATPSMYGTAGNQGRSEETMYGGSVYGVAAAYRSLCPPRSRWTELARATSFSGHGQLRLDHM